MTVTNSFLAPHHRRAMLCYVVNHQQSDGGWGTHVEGPSTMFGTVLNYVAMRLLGMKKESTESIAGKKFIRKHGSALTAPSWAKFWLTVLGVHEWEGVNPVPSEMLLLPRWFPFHPL